MVLTPTMMLNMSSCTCCVKEYKMTLEGYRVYEGFHPYKLTVYLDYLGF